MDKKYKRRLITLLLSLTLIISYMPTSFLAYAVDDDPAVTTEDPSGGEGNTTNGGQTTNGTSEGTATTGDQTGGTAEDAPSVNSSADGTTSETDSENGDESEEPEKPNIELIAEFKDGAVEREGHLVKSVENDNSGQEFQYSIKMDINKEVYSLYNEGSIKIYIPAGILYVMKQGSNGSTNNGTYDLSLDRTREESQYSCNLKGSVVKYDDRTPNDDWYYKREYKDGRYYNVIINNKKMADIDANTVQFDVIYKTLSNSYAYADYDNTNSETLKRCASDPFDVRLEAKATSGLETKLDAHAPEVYIDTSAVISSVKKELATTWEAVETDDEGNETNYLYLQYKVDVRVKGTTPSSKPTQQYDLIFDDVYSGAFSNMKATWKTGSGATGTGEFELIGFGYGGQDPTKYYKDEDGTYTMKGAWTPQEYITRYMLVRVEKPEDALTLDYSLTNNIKVTVDPIGGGDASSTMYSKYTWMKSYNNTRPTGRFMIHKWSNSNYDSVDHSRTDAYGVHTNYKRDWGHQNNELNFFKDGSIDILRQLRYFVWYEGYSVRYTPYTEPHEMSYEFVDQDLGIWYYPMTSYKDGKYENAEKLTANDYYFSEIDFYPEAQNATYDTEKGRWKITRSGDPFTGDEPIIIEARFGSKTAEWKPVAKVSYSKDYSASKAEATGTVVWSDTSVDVSFGEYDGEKYSSKDTGFIIKFKDNNCVGYRIRHTNKHYYFMCCVKPIVNVKRTTHVLNKMPYGYIYIPNYADMSVYDEDSVSETNTTGRIFNFNNDAGEHLVNRVGAAAAVTQNNLLRTNKYHKGGKKDDDNRLYQASWMMCGAGYAYAGITAIGQEYPRTYEKLNKGTFFDVLPRGAELYEGDGSDPSRLKVYNVLLDSSSYYKYTQEDDSSYKPELDEKYLLTEGVDYTVETIEGNYNGHSLNGLTLLKITINKTVAQPTEDYCLPGYTVVYDTISYYEDLNRYGNTLLNATAFEAGNGTTYHEMGFPDDPKGHDQHKNDNNNNQGNSSLLMNISNEHPDREAVLTALKDMDPDPKASSGYWFGYDFDSVTVYYNEYNLSGLSKRVRLAGETNWGINRKVKPGGQYQYRIRYATDSGTKVKDVILYDKIEGYKTPEGVPKSDWYGTLNSMSFELPRGVNAKPEDFKYYISNKDDAVVDSAIDLTDTSVWTKVDYGADLLNTPVKWVAVDTTGFTLDTSSSMSLILTMTAPTENPTELVWPTTYNDSHSKGIQYKGTTDADGTAFSNVSNQTQVIYGLGGEVWIEKVDENGDPIANVTFTLKGTSSLKDQNGNPAQVDMTAKTDRNGHAIFKNVPISGEGQYTLAEVVPSGYVDEGTTWIVEILANGSTQINGEDKTGEYLNVVNKEGTEISVEKKWLRYQGSSYPPQGAKVTMTLYEDGKPTEESVVLDGKKDDKQAGKPGYEYEPWKAKFTGLPKYKTVLGIEKEIVYTVAETEGWPGYTASTTDPVENGGIITNKEDTVNLWADKRWLNLDGSLTPPEGAKISFYLSKMQGNSYSMLSGYKIELDGIVDEEPEKSGAYESEPWRASFKNLPKYEIANGELVEIDYRIREVAPYWQDWNPYNPDASPANVVSSGGTITNRPLTTSRTAYKRWRNVDGTTSAPEGATVTLTLFADGESTGISCVLDGTAEDMPENEITTYCYEGAAWRANFVNLPRYNSDYELIKYTIKETAGWPGYTASPIEVENYGYIYNEMESVEVTAEKDWADSEGNKINPPTGARVTFTLYADDVEVPNKKVVLDGTPATYVNNNGYEYEAWKAKFPKLPKYRVEIENGVPTAVEIDYKVKETVTWPGYSPSTEDGVESGGVITNTPQMTELTVEKVWDPVNMTGEAPDNANVTFTLVVDGVESTTKKVVLDGTPDAEANDNGYESAAWKAKFPNLPKYKIVNNKEVEIDYKVKETGTWPGYKVVYEGGETATYAVDGGKITNREELVSLSVKKAWYTYDGSNVSSTPPPNAQVTFTLYADGVSTGYTVTLDGQEEGFDSIMFGGQETEPWVATFVRLPKYRIDDKGEAKLIEYTVKETGTWPGYTVNYPGGEERTYAVDDETITNTKISIHFEGTKNIEGRSFRDYDKWTFTVTPLTTGAPMPVDDNGNAINPYEYVLDTSSGIVPGTYQAKFVTDDIEYTMADVGKTYKYRIVESGQITGVTNDTTVYTVTVTIESNNDGTLKVTKVYTRPQKPTIVPFDPHIPGGRILDGYEVGWLNNLELEEQELKPFNPGTGEINPGNGGTVLPFNPDTPGGGIDEKLVEKTNDAEFTNVYTPPDLEITKTLDGYVDGGKMSNVTLAFEVKGYVNDENGQRELKYHNYVGITFSKNDEIDPETGLYKKTVRLTGLPELDEIEVLEVYSGNYKPGQTGAVPATYNNKLHLWTVALSNTHKGYTPGSGVINKYRDGTVTQEGLIESGGDTSAGNGGN